MIEQHALTVVARIRPGNREPLLALLDSSRDAVLTKLVALKTLHFGRFVVIDRANGDAALALETNYDGDEDTHLADLELCIGIEIDEFFAFCNGYTQGRFADYARACSIQPRAYYIAHGGLSVTRIQEDAEVRRALEDWLDTPEKAGRLTSMDARSIASALKGELSKRGLAVGPIDRGLPREPYAKISFVLAVLRYGPVAAVLAGIAKLRYEPRDDVDARENPPQLKSDHDPYVAAIIDAEDASAQNGLTHVVAVKPGSFRHRALSLVLSFVEQARRHLCFKGNLGGIATIHFARWVLLDDGTLVFFSNYDGSWESYLGDFVDKANYFLTGIWTNTRWFPRTSFLVCKGASAEAEFKQWARNFQVRNPIWYSAYPDLTVANVLQNATIRELAGGALDTDHDARAWLALL